MALIYADLCVEQSTATTTGAYQLGGVPTGQRAGAQTFVAGIGTGNACLYYAYEVGGGAWEKGQGTVIDAAPDTLSRDRIDGSSNGGSAVDWTGKTLNVELVLPARQLFTDSHRTIQNLTIATSRSANAETIAIKNGLGADASKNNPIRIGFQDGSGGFSVQEITTAMSFTISSGSTLGAVSAEPFRLWLVLFNDAGTLRPGVIKCYTGTGIASLRDGAVESSTAEGGAGAADTAGIFYTATAVTAKVYRIIGSLEYTLTTAGTWVSAPSFVNLFAPGDKQPGDVVQTKRTDYSAVATGTVIIPTDDTIPQISEGTQFMAQAITPQSAANLLKAKAYAMLATSINVASDLHGAMFFGDQADAIFSVTATSAAQYYRWSHKLQPPPRVAGSTSSITHSYRAGPGAAGTITFNGYNAGRVFGAMNKSFISVEEIMV